MIHPNVLFISLNLVLWFCIYVCLSPALRKPYIVRKDNRQLGVFFILIYLLFCFWGDWFHYNDEFLLVKKGIGYGLEEIYNWIIENLCIHYLIFRIIVWWTAFLLLCLTTNNFNLNLNLTLLFLGCGWMTLFAYARVTLAMCVLFYGFSLFYGTQKKIFLGILLILSSFFLHKTAAFGIAMVLLGIVLSKLNPKLLVCLILLSPILIGVIKQLLFNFMLGGFDISNSSFEMSAMSGQRYLQKDSEESGLAALIRSFFEYSAFYTMSYVCFLTLLKRNSSKICQSMKTLSIIYMLIILCASIFAFDLGFNTKVLYVRFLRYALVPAVLLMTYYYQINFKKKLIKLIFILTCCMTVYATFYTIYLTYVGVDLAAR